MEMIMEYHLVFIVISVIFLLYAFRLLFQENTKENTIAAVIICAMNYVLCMINSYGFFGIGIIGIDSDGVAVITANHDMYSIYAFFFMLYWVNIVFIFYAYWLWVRNPWRIGETGSSDISDDNFYY